MFILTVFSYMYLWIFAMNMELYIANDWDCTAWNKLELWWATQNHIALLLIKGIPNLASLNTPQLIVVVVVLFDVVFLSKIHSPLDSDLTRCSCK